MVRLWPQRSASPSFRMFTRSRQRPDGRRVSASSWSATIPDPRSTFATRSCGHGVRPLGATCDGCRRCSAADLLALVQELNDSERHDGILVQSLCRARWARRRAAGVRRDRSCQGRRRLHPDQRRPPRAGTRAACSLHAVGRHRDARPDRDPDRRRARRRRRAAATSSASRWRCCCCIATRPSRSVIPRLRTCRLARHRRHPRGRDRPPRIRHAGFVKPGATVIDVGISTADRRGDSAEDLRAGFPAARRLRPARSAGRRRRAPAVADKAGALTPVPGGVGPLTIAMLLKKTLTAARSARHALESMLRAALTGGIATGKSYCLSRFAAVGAAVIDADQLAHQAVDRGSDGLKEVVNRFGGACCFLTAP